MERVVSETVAGADVTGYLSKRAAAAYLSISLRTLEHLPGLRRYRVGRMVRYRQTEIDAWMAQHAEPARTEAKRESRGLRDLAQQARRRALMAETNTITGGQEG